MDAGLEKSSVIGSEVSVHVGLANNDWIQMQSWDVRKISPYTATGLDFIDFPFIFIDFSLNFH